MAKKIPATVITGFLGAGKTSLIRHLVENNKGRRLAFLINEFGDLGIDRELLLGCGIESCNEENVVELANGCICCTVADDFLPAMESLLARDDQPDHILIEPSGLALPKPLVTAFNWPEIRSKVTVDGVVTVVDAAAVDDGRMAPDPIAVQAARANDPALDHDDPLPPPLHLALEKADECRYGENPHQQGARYRPISTAPWWWAVSNGEPLWGWSRAIGSRPSHRFRTSWALQT